MHQNEYSNNVRYNKSQGERSTFTLINQALRLKNVSHKFRVQMSG